MDMNFAGLAYAYTAADIAINPAVRLEDTELELHTVGIGYIHTFKMFDHSARFDLVQAFKDARFTGLLRGVPASADCEGAADTRARLAVHLYGAPPLAGKAYAAYRAGVDVETLFAAALGVQFPTGEYMEDKLINLCTNRFTFRRQLGVVHNRGAWSFESTAVVALFTENDEFFGGNVLEQDPFYSVDSHVVYTVGPGLWSGVGLGYGYGGENTVNGKGSGDRKENFAWGLSFGYPVTPRWGFKVACIGTGTREAVGSDTNTIIVGVSTFW